MFFAVDVQGNTLTGTLPLELALLTELEHFAAINDRIEGNCLRNWGL
jgi:hypothetical protein